MAGLCWLGDWRKSFIRETKALFDILSNDDKEKNLKGSSAVKVPLPASFTIEG